MKKIYIYIYNVVLRSFIFNVVLVLFIKNFIYLYMLSQDI